LDEKIEKVEKIKIVGFFCPNVADRGGDCGEKSCQQQLREKRRDKLKLGFQNEGKRREAWV